MTIGELYNTDALRQLVEEEFVRAWARDAIAAYLEAAFANLPISTSENGSKTAF